MEGTLTKQKLFINGNWVETMDVHPIYNKYSGELLTEVHKADNEHVDKAITSSIQALKNVSFTPEQRYSVLSKVSYLLLEKEDEIAQIISQEDGKPITDAKLEVKRSAHTFLIAAEEAKKLTGEIIQNFHAQGRFIYTVKKPVGVVAAITPFNFPLNLVAHKVAPALAAGNPVILKPASDTAFIALKLCEFLEEAGVPKGYLHCVIGSGSTVGEQLLKDERIAHYTFTGSPAVGKHIQKTIGLRKATLELGSNSATIVHHDADIEQAATKLAKMSFAHAGQICISVQRIFVHQSIEEQFMKVFLEQVANLKVGDPLDPETNVGPMISEKEAKRIEQWVNEAVEEGAEVLTGGKREGSIYYPTVIKQAKKA